MAAVVTATAGTLRALHRAGEPLVLPNAWDAASASAVQQAGFQAVATSSAAMAESLGYADGEAAPVEEILDAVARIAAAVTIPVTADLERGYRMPPAELVERLVATGATGCNLEDTDPRTGELVDVGEQAEFLAEVRAAASGVDMDLVINARIDVFISGDGPAGDRVAEAIRRARAYLAAGADCVYPILVTERPAVRVLVEQSGGPVNILHQVAAPGMPSISELAGLGVARISFGPGLFRAVHAHLRELLTGVRAAASPFLHDRHVESSLAQRKIAS